MNLAEFGDWALAQKSVANPEQNNKYKGECVSLIQQYLSKVFGKGFKAYGNAKDWENNYPKEYFNKLASSEKLQEGDVLVYGGNFGKGYGHIALMDINMKFFDQNGIKKGEVAYQDEPFKGYKCILRPLNQKALGIIREDRIRISQTYTTQVNLKVRDGAGIDKRWKLRSELSQDGQKNAKDSINAVLKQGTKVTCLGMKEIKKDLWIKIPSGWIAARYEGKIYVK